MHKLREAVTAERIRELLDYDPENGLLTWKVGRNRIPARSIAGTLSADGYITISVDGVLYRAHRLAWLYMTGEWPQRRLDHEDTIRSNNKWRNLRLSTQSQNIANARKYKNNTSGIKGVSWYKPYQKWRAQIMKDGKTTSLGYFYLKEDAATAYRRAAEDLFGSFSRAA